MMKHKHVIALLCAAGTALASVPAFPAVAAAETAVSASAEHREEITDDGDLLISDRTEDGLGWEILNDGNAGTVDCSAGEFGKFRFEWKDVQHAQFTIGSSGHVDSEEDFEHLSYRYAGTPELGKSGYFGFVGSPAPLVWYYIADGWAENSPVSTVASGTKLGTVSADGRDYDIFRTEKMFDEKNVSTDYWLIPHNNRYRAGKQSFVKNIVSVGSLMQQAAVICEDLRTPDYSPIYAPGFFVDTGSDASGKTSGSADFDYCWYKDRYTFGKFNVSKFDDGGFLEESYHDYYLGTTDMSVGENGSFQYTWNDIDYALVNVHKNFPDGKSELLSLTDGSLYGLTWNYAGEVNLGGYGFFGLSYRMTELSSVMIVDGWDEYCAEWKDAKEKLGEIKLNNMIYDVYEQDEWYSRGRTVKLYWCIRRENLYHGANSIVSNEIPFLPAFRQIAAIGGVSDVLSVNAPTMFVSSGYSETGYVSGSAKFTQNIFDYSNKYFNEMGRKDGYDWLRLQACYDCGTSMTVGDKGTFEAKWDDLPSNALSTTLFLSGKQPGTTLDHIKTLTAKYQMEGTISGYQYHGYVSTFADESGDEPELTEVYVTNVYPSHYSDYEIGGMELETADSSEQYKFYLIPVTDQTKYTLSVTPQKYTKQQCWIVKNGSNNKATFEGTERASLNLLELYSKAEQLGVRLGKLKDTSFFLLADTGTGSVSVTQNDITIETDGTVSTVPQSKVRGDANCDGVLDVSDAVLTARVLVEDIEAEITQQGLKNADANGSGKLESEDLSMLLQAIAKKIKL